MTSQEQHEPRTRRRLGHLDILAIGVNAIVGAGIYLLPGHIATHLGGASWLAFLVVGVLLVSVALCFAQVSSMFEETGGPYLYAREAFGRSVGFAVGWVSLVTMLVSWAAVAAGLLASVGHFVPTLGHGLTGRVAIAAFLGLLGLINVLGIKPGAWTTNAFTAAKLLPLLAFVAIGLFFIQPANVSAAPPSWSALGSAVFIAVFAVQGFEVAPIPAGETKNPRRVVPVAILGSLMGSVALYVLIMMVAVGTTPGIAGSDTPLTDAATTFMGPWGASILAVGGIVSMVGFNAGIALVAPQYVAAFAEDGWIPRSLARRHRRFDSPVLAIVVSALIVLAGAWFVDFERLVNFANISVIMQYGVTILAVIVLPRKKALPSGAWRLPGGPLIPMIALVVTAGLCLQASWREAAWAGGVVVLGILLTLVTGNKRGHSPGP